jgi:hypothetical protein
MSSDAEWEDDDGEPAPILPEPSKKSPRPSGTSATSKRTKSPPTKSSRTISSKAASKTSTRKLPKGREQKPSSPAKRPRKASPRAAAHSEAPVRAAIQITLSGNKIAYANGAWIDVTDPEELAGSVHPIVAENISLKKRAELLVRLVAEREYETHQIEDEIVECDEVIRDLSRMMGDSLDETDGSTLPPDESSSW